mmetsp:Transcript_71502/g.225816  ORF Transcript_71502/g.225816 Transcript_71502/m.225816 type:complete len:129 (-) Transcript_71502:2-388(-)
MSRCLERRAAFVLTPCCLGKIGASLKGKAPPKRGGGVEAPRHPAPAYPRSVWLGREMGEEEYCHLVRLADYNRHDAGGAYRASKELMDADRLGHAEEHGYATGAGKLWPKGASAKDDVLVGGVTAWWE